MQLRFWAATDTGRVRDHNEDNFLVDENLQLFVVCDGMGGHAAGEVASAVCVRTVREVVAGETELLQRLRDNPDDNVVVERFKAVLRKAVKAGNSRIFEMAKEDPSRRGMGTTCTAVALVGNRGFVGHVGDSRLYRLREHRIEQLTDDHSLLNEMIRQGKVSADTTEEEFQHQNAVTRAVGVRETVDVDAFGFDTEVGDRLLICSDGLSEYLSDDIDFASMMGAGEPREATTDCIEFANQSGGKDNITVVVVDCGIEAEHRDASGVESDAKVVGDDQIDELLCQIPYFHYMAPAELQAIRKLAERMERDAGETVIDAEEENDRLFLILRGAVTVRVDGHQVTELETGAHFGEMALLDAQHEHDANTEVETLESSAFLTLEQQRFVSLLRTDPGLAIKLLWNFVQVFADRLQRLPSKIRYAPEQWVVEAEAVAGADGEQLHEATESNEEDRQPEPIEPPEPSDELPPPIPSEATRPPMGKGRSGSTDSPPDAVPPSEGREPDSETVEEIGGPPPSMLGDDDSEELPLDRQKTASLKDLRSRLGAKPPRGDKNEEDDKVRRTVPLESFSSDEESPSVKINSPQDRSRDSTPDRRDDGISSGTYDQGLLEEATGDDGDRQMPPGPPGSNEFEPEDFADDDFEAQDFEIDDSGPYDREGAESDDGDIRSTVQLDWDKLDRERPSGPVSSVGADDEDVAVGGETIDLNADDREELEELRRSYRREQERERQSTPGAGVLKRPGNQKEEVDDEDGSEESARDPKVMVSSELMDQKDD